MPGPSPPARPNASPDRKPAGKSAAASGTKGAVKSLQQAGKGPGTKNQYNNGKSAFYSAVLTEAAKYADKSKEEATNKEDAESREHLQLELK